MNHVATSIRQAVEQQNWYAALALALAVPDICGRIALPEEKSSRRRFEAWWAEWAEPAFTAERPTKHVFVPAGDAYALRCSFLHEGSGDLFGHKAREAVDRFTFVDAPMHLIVVGKHLMLNIGQTCHAICDALERWLADPANEQSAHAAPLLKIQVGNAASYSVSQDAWHLSAGRLGD